MRRQLHKKLHADADFAAQDNKKRMKSKVLLKRAHFPFHSHLNILIFIVFGLSLLASLPNSVGCSHIHSQCYVNSVFFSLFPPK